VVSGLRPAAEQIILSGNPLVTHHELHAWGGKGKRAWSASLVAEAQFAAKAKPKSPETGPATLLSCKIDYCCSAGSPARSIGYRFFTDD